MEIREGEQFSTFNSCEMAFPDPYVKKMKLQESDADSKASPTFPKHMKLKAKCKKKTISKHFAHFKPLFWHFSAPKRARSSNSSQGNTSSSSMPLQSLADNDITNMANDYGVIHILPNKEVKEIRNLERSRTKACL